MNAQSRNAQTINRAIIFWLLSILFIVSNGCSVRLIADYDENLDNGITNLQRKTETFLSQLETDLVKASLLKNRTKAKKKLLNKVAYEAHEDFYRDFVIDLRILKVRADSYVGNELTVKQLDKMEEILEEQKKLHMAGLTSPEDISIMRNAFTRGFKGILKLEIAKKRGKK